VTDATFVAGRPAPGEKMASGMIRQSYDNALHELQEQIMRMASLAGTLIHRSVVALRDRDARAAEMVIHDDAQIDRLHVDIEQRVLSIIATQQPMAGDLRLLTAALAISIDLERLADHAEGIAKCARRLSREPMLKPLVDIPYMETIVHEMLQEVMQSFVKRDPAAAEACAKKDDTLDSIRSQVFRELLTYMSEDPRTISRALDLILAAQHLERAGDHVTNIAERVVFLVTGELIELNT
jgi:phosphate transport system protein